MMVPSRELDRRFRGVGRIRLSSGTPHPPTFRRINEMMSILYQTGRLDLLRAIRDRVLTPLQVLDAYRSNRLEFLPTAEMLLPLRSTWRDWLASHEVTPKTRKGYREVAIHLDALVSDAHTLEDLPRLLMEVRGKLATEGKAATFNRLRSAAQAFFRVTLGERHKLWADVKSVKRLKEHTKRVSQPKTVAELDALAQKFDADVRACVWSMASTGMGPGEYWGEWGKKDSWLHVHGTKAKGRERIIPDLGLCVMPPIGRNTFRLRLQKQTAKAGVVLSAYDLRHTFATWMDDAGIPHSRLKSYMGHGASNVTDTYLWREVRPYLAADAHRLTAFMRLERAKEKARIKADLANVPGNLPGLRLVSP